MGYRSQYISLGSIKEDYDQDQDKDKAEDSKTFFFSLSKLL